MPTKKLRKRGHSNMETRGAVAVDGAQRQSDALSSVSSALARRHRMQRHGGVLTAGPSGPRLSTASLCRSAGDSSARSRSSDSPLRPTASPDDSLYSPVDSLYSPVVPTFGHGHGMPNLVDPSELLPLFHERPRAAFAARSPPSPMQQAGPLPVAASPSVRDVLPVADSASVRDVDHLLSAANPLSMLPVPPPPPPAVREPPQSWWEALEGSRSATTSSASASSSTSSASASSSTSSVTRPASPLPPPPPPPAVCGILGIPRQTHVLARCFCSLDGDSAPSRLLRVEARPEPAFASLDAHTWSGYHFFFTLVREQSESSIALRSLTSVRQCESVLDVSTTSSRHRLRIRDPAASQSLASAIVAAMYFSQPMCTAISYDLLSREQFVSEPSASSAPARSLCGALNFFRDSDTLGAVEGDKIGVLVELIGFRVDTGAQTTLVHLGTPDKLLRVVLGERRTCLPPAVENQLLGMPKRRGAVRYVAASERPLAVRVDVDTPVQAFIYKFTMRKWKTNRRREDHAEPAPAPPPPPPPPPPAMPSAEVSTDYSPFYPSLAPTPAHVRPPPCGMVRAALAARDRTVGSPAASRLPAEFTAFLASPTNPPHPPPPPPPPPVPLLSLRNPPPPSPPPRRRHRPTAAELARGRSRLRPSPPARVLHRPVVSNDPLPSTDAFQDLLAALERRRRDTRRAHTRRPRLRQSLFDSDSDEERPRDAEAEESTEADADADPFADIASDSGENQPRPRRLRSLFGDTDEEGDGDSVFRAVPVRRRRAPLPESLFGDDDDDWAEPAPPTEPCSRAPPPPPLRKAFVTVEEQPLDDDLTCCVCFDVFSEPVCHRECGHLFCSACLRLAGRCPVCRGPVFDWAAHTHPSSRQLQSMVDRVLVRCEECTAVMPRSERAAHDGLDCASFPTPSRPPSTSEPADSWVGFEGPHSQPAPAREAQDRPVACAASAAGCPWVGPDSQAAAHAASCAFAQLQPLLTAQREFMENLQQTVEEQGRQIALLTAQLAMLTS